MSEDSNEEKFKVLLNSPPMSIPKPLWEDYQQIIVEKRECLERVGKLVRLLEEEKARLNRIIGKAEAYATLLQRIGLPPLNPPQTDQELDLGIDETMPSAPETETSIPAADPHIPPS